MLQPSHDYRSRLHYSILNPTITTALGLRLVCPVLDMILIFPTGRSLVLEKYSPQVICTLGSTTDYVRQRSIMFRHTAIPFLKVKLPMT